MVASVVLAAAVVIGGAFADQTLLGAGIGVGLVLGALNGFFIQATLDRRAPILATSLLRLAMFTLLALIAARLVGGSVWSVVAGIATSQLIMVGIGVRQGWRV
jgi:hypothetical protein